MKHNFTLSLLLVFLLGTALAEESHKMVISQWLVSPPVEISLPVFHDQKNTSGDVFQEKDFLSWDIVSVKDHFPEEGKSVMNHNNLVWKKKNTDDNAFVFADDKDSEKVQISWFAAYIWADRYMEADLEIQSPHKMKAWLNHESIGTKNSFEEEEGTLGKVSKSLKLERGKHLLLIKSVKSTEASLDWKLKASLEVKEPYVFSDLQFDINPKNRKNIQHIMDGTKISSVHLSADGSHYLVNYSRSQPPSDNTERWTEVKKADNGRLIHSFRHSRVSRVNWLPSGNRLSYTTVQDGKASLFVFDIEQGNISLIMEDIDNFSGYSWAPDESFIIYSLREEGSKIDGDMRRFVGLRDRQGHFRSRTFLYHYDLATSTHTRLTFGNMSTFLQDISPDSKQIAFSQTFSDYPVHPYSRQNSYILNLQDMRLDTLWTDELRSVNINFSPDGKYLLGTGGPSSFDGIGENVSEGSIPNNYDTQAYIYEIATGEVNPFTKEFDPSLISAHWNKSDNHIYLHVVEEDFRYLYRYEVRRNRFSKVNLNADYLSGVSFAGNAPQASVTISQTNAPSAVHLLNLSNQRMRLLEDTESHNYRHVELGDIKQWDFTSSEGVEIKGRVYYPPGFDADSRYPVIVYYYAGTTPVGRTFGGRYPFNLWAGNDYIVYVLQPSGATGFGQDFSAAHVNNWGTTVADEIIEGTQKFLEAHPYANAEKVGCAGASYGGFMTMLLMTRTDIYAAAISHAGISSISSYWGVGLWGYAYSSEASAGSYPWNNMDLYIGQSPLFHADKIHTPLLLITGDSDTNVPPGESIQLYTALKILDRPVELITVKGEDHHIVTYGKRILWHNALMAWWDKHLKDQPQWWEAQYPTKNY